MVVETITGRGGAQDNLARTTMRVGSHCEFATLYDHHSNMLVSKIKK